MTKTIKNQIITLNNIIKLLKEKEDQLKQDQISFKNKINLYGIINYTRIQYLPQLSSYITKNKDYKDIFFNYTSAESMVIDIISVIESDLIQNLEEKNYYNLIKTTKLITFTIKLLIIIQNIFKTKYKEDTIDKKEYQEIMEQNTQSIFNLQNQFYTLIYDEKIDIRIK